MGAAERIAGAQRGEGPANAAGYPRRPRTGETGLRAAKAAPEERQLLEVLLADPELVAQAAPVIRAEEIAHPGLRALLEGLYALRAAGEPPTLDLLRPRLDNVHAGGESARTARRRPGHARPAGVPAAAPGLLSGTPPQAVTQELHTQLNAVRDLAAELELLRQLQNRNVELGPGSSTVAEARS